MDASALSQLVLDDADQKPHRLGDLWATHPVILVWLRHFG